MSLAFKRVKVYTKLTLFLIVAVAIGTVLVNNRGHSVRVWFFGLVDAEQEVNVVWLMLWTAVAAIISWWVMAATIGLVRDTRELRREREFQRREQTQRELAAKLQEQEHRIDEKIDQALRRDSE